MSELAHRIADRYLEAKHFITVKPGRADDALFEAAETLFYRDKVAWILDEKGEILKEYRTTKKALERIIGIIHGIIHENDDGTGFPETEVAHKEVDRDARRFKMEAVTNPRTGKSGFKVTRP